MLGLRDVGIPGRRLGGGGLGVVVGVGRVLLLGLVAAWGSGRGGAVEAGVEAPVEAGAWREWRGPGGQGHAPGVRGIPATWSEGENVRWRTALPGRGHSSPVVGGGKVWITTAIETPAAEEVVAERRKTYTGGPAARFLSEVVFRVLQIDLATGRVDRDLEVLRRRDPPAVHQLNGYASPTPVLAGDGLYVHFGTFGTACIEVETGRVRWLSRTLRFEQDNGPASSPFVWRDLVIVVADGSDVQYVAALDRETGRVRWKSDRTGVLGPDPQTRKSYGTPIVAEFGGRPELLSSGADWVYSYDPASGRELWKLAYGVSGYAVVARPVLGPGMVYLSTGFLRAELLAVRYDGTGPATVAWRWKRSAPQTCSPILVGEELYFVNDSGGLVTCLDARSGAAIYQERLGGNHSASPSFADGRLFFHDQEGVTTVVRPGRTFEVLARNRLEGSHFASAAFVDDSILLRTDRALYRIGK